MIRSDGVELVISFSDQGLKILGENGFDYDNAVDPKELHRTYIETKFLANDFTPQVNYWLRQIHEDKAVMTDIPDVFRYMVQEKLEEEKREQLIEAARILFGEEKPEVNYAERAEVLRPLIEKAVNSLSDEDALAAIELFAEWLPNDIPYAENDKVRYERELYKCLQTHESRSSWNPKQANALWTKLQIPE